MNVKCDPEAGSLYLRFVEVDVVDTEEVRPGVMFDFDANGRIVAIELLDISKRLAEGEELKARFAA